MTKKEMTEIFSVMLLAWPNAEMFKGGVAKLGPTIELWTACLSDVDFWLGQQAVIRLCRECKFPPSIAEFKEKADNVQQEIKPLVQSMNRLFGKIFVAVYHFRNFFRQCFSQPGFQRFERFYLFGCHSCLIPQKKDLCKEACFSLLGLFWIHYQQVMFRV